MKTYLENENMGYFNKKKNQQERLTFVKQWADYVRTHSDKEWSRQQKVLIDSQLKGAEKPLITVKDYLKIKQMVRKEDI